MIANYYPLVPKKAPIIPEWMSKPPSTFEEKLHLLKIKKHLLNDNTEIGLFLRRLLAEVKLTSKLANEQARHLDPLRFFKPSFEQALILNSWIYGIAFNCIYSANRIGKTTACIINFFLWILPNNPQWRIFKPYRVGDESDVESASNPNKGKLVQVFQRPDIETFRLIQRLVKRRPLSIPAPNPRLPHYDKQNRPFLQWLQKALAKHSPSSHPLTNPFPAPPWNVDGVIWAGAPDHSHFVQIIMPLWRQYCPSSIIETDVVTDHHFTFIIPQQTSATDPTPSMRKTTWEWIGKSYETKETKWSSGAVDAIILTEGVLKSVWSEIKARFKDPAIGSHDFTPFEPANAGAATALAQKIKKGTEPVPLPHFVFEEFSVHAAPRHIVSDEKYNQLVTSYQGTDEGKARLEGKFYTSSALVLSNLDRQLHLLDWTIPELFSKFPTARLYRGIDPGLDHPTACAWGALLPTNQWVIYRMLCEPGLSISQRAATIVELSNNQLSKKRFGPKPTDFYLEEIHPNPTSEVFVASTIDYHVFKEDETTGLNYALNYSTAGLVVTESVHTGPEDRATTLDDLLKPNPFVPDLRTNQPPGPRVYFLRNSPGIMAAVLKWEEYYWDRKRSGEDKGSPKDKVPLHGDDELDAVCYLTSSPFKWTAYQPPAKLGNDSEPELELIEASQSLSRSRQGTDYLADPNLRGDLQSLQNRKHQRQRPTFAPVYFGNPLNQSNGQPDFDDEDPHSLRLDRY